MPTYFSVALFFVLLREALEVSIVISVLLSFIDRAFPSSSNLLKRSKRSTWIGTLSAFIITLILGGTIIFIWYKYSANVVEANELIYEGTFGLISSVFILVTGLAFLKGQHIYEKMDRKLSEKVNAGVFTLQEGNDGYKIDNEEIQALEKAEVEYLPSPKLFFWIPFLTVLREGLESVVLVGGVSFAEDPHSIPLSAVTGIITGCSVGYIIHRASNKLSLKWFFILGSYILFLMAAGIFSRSVGIFEDNAWTKLIGAGDDPDANTTVDPRMNVWYLPKANEKELPGFGIMFSLLGYRHVATIGTIVGYCAFWLVLCAGLVFLKSRRKSKSKKTEFRGERTIVAVQ